MSSRSQLIGTDSFASRQHAARSALDKVFGQAMSTYGHCGNADWIINLADYAASAGIASGALYLALSTAPGFFACGLLRER